MAYEREARTAFASKALELSDMFMIKFGRRAFGGAISRTVHVAPPEESTAGGRLAREAISLIPAGGAAGATLVIGWMNVAENRAELRAYPVLAEIHRQRFGGVLDLSRPDYDGFLDEARRFFSEEGIALELLSEPPAPPPSKASASAVQGTSVPRSAPSDGVPLGVVAALLVVTVGIGIGIGWLLFAP